MKRIGNGILFIVIMGCIGCIHTQVNPAPAQKIEQICIIENPKVIRPRVMQYIDEALKSQGIETAIYRASTPDCAYTIQYTARYRWDFVLYLAYAKFTLYGGDQVLGFAEYDAWEAGLALTKFGTDKSKIEPLLHDLLGNLRGI